MCYGPSWAHHKDRQEQNNKAANSDHCQAYCHSTKQYSPVIDTPNEMGSNKEDHSPEKETDRGSNFRNAKHPYRRYG